MAKKDYTTHYMIKSSGIENSPEYLASKIIKNIKKLEKISHNNTFIVEKTITLSSCGDIKVVPITLTLPCKVKKAKIDWTC